MAKSRSKITGPVIDDGIEFAVIPCNKKALEKLRDFHGGDAGLLNTMRLISPIQFAGKRAGELCIKDAASSWSGKYCPYVTIRDTDSLNTPKAKELRAKIRREEEALAALLEKTDVTSQKAKLIGCMKCDSKVNKQFIKDSVCPVCGNGLRSKSANASIFSKEQKIASLKRKYGEDCT